MCAINYKIKNDDTTLPMKKKMNLQKFPEIFSLTFTAIAAVISAAAAKRVLVLLIPITVGLNSVAIAQPTGKGKPTTNEPDTIDRSPTVCRSFAKDLFKKLRLSPKNLAGFEQAKPEFSFVSAEKVALDRVPKEEHNPGKDGKPVVQRQPKSGDFTSYRYIEIQGGMTSTSTDYYYQIEYREYRERPALHPPVIHKFKFTKNCEFVDYIVTKESFKLESDNEKSKKKQKQPTLEPHGYSIVANERCEFDELSGVSVLDPNVNDPETLEPKISPSMGENTPTPSAKKSFLPFQKKSVDVDTLFIDGKVTFLRPEFHRGLCALAQSSKIEAPGNPVVETVKNVQDALTPKYKNKKGSAQ